MRQIKSIQAKLGICWYSTISWYSSEAEPKPKSRYVCTERYIPLETLPIYPHKSCFSSEDLRKSKISSRLHEKPRNLSKNARFIWVTFNLKSTPMWTIKATRYLVTSNKFHSHDCWGAGKIRKWSLFQASFLQPLRASSCSRSQEKGWNQFTPVSNLVLVKDINFIS